MNNRLIKQYGLSSNMLKVLALITMIIDHTGLALFPQYRIMRYIGRLAFPIYCFLIAEGFLHTRNVYKYASRLFLFALISEIPFNLLVKGQLFYSQDQNVFFTLLIGLVVLIFASRTADSSYSASICLVGMLIAVLLRTDYSAYGVLMIYCFYKFKENPLVLSIWIIAINFIMGIGGTGSQKYAALSMIPILLYSGKKTMSGDKKDTILNEILKYGFYIIYPAHLVLLYFIRKYYF